MSDDFFNFGDSAPAAAAAAPPPAAPEDDFLGGGGAPAEQDDFFGGGGEKPVEQEETIDVAAEPQEAQADPFAGEGDVPAPPPQAQDDFFPQGEQSAPAQEPEPMYSESAEPTDFGAQETVVEEETPAPPPEPPRPVEIPPLVKWEIQNREDIAAKDQVAKEKEDKMKQDAGQVIAQFYEERTDLVKASHDRNTGAEAEFCKQRDALFSHGEVWERVVSLIDMKAANEKKPQQRTARMRQLLLQLKNEAK